eukprot:366546-Chlamydomonas_euryale.AAC.9
MLGICAAHAQSLGVHPQQCSDWVKQQNIPEKYVLMAEPDHVYIRPLKNFMTSESPGGVQLMLP